MAVAKAPYFISTTTKKHFAQIVIFMFYRSFWLIPLLLASIVMSSTPATARSPRRYVQACSPQSKSCKMPVKRRLLACPNNSRQLCLRMKGDQTTFEVAHDRETLTWQHVPDATYYQISIAGYKWHWQSAPLTHPTCNYANLPLKPGNAYLVTISAYGPEGLMTLAEQVINPPAIVTTNFQ
ncbi:MAG: fibronectin type III domain-containing protein [Synechococcales cyanobacterium CRU_2_2]|nr:fibronectin type III domain-containing protein [Synechococcales cyanobacterium CRU_2_2]